MGTVAAGTTATTTVDDGAFGTAVVDDDGTVYVVLTPPGNGTYRSSCQSSTRSCSGTPLMYSGP